MVAMPLYGINPLKSLVFRNQKADFDETWYEVSEAQAYYMLLLNFEPPTQKTF